MLCLQIRNRPLSIPTISKVRASKMISPTSWLKCMGVGGQLAPFFKCVCVYFIALGVSGELEPSVLTAACKCAPVLCLLAATLTHALSLPPHKRRYSGLVCTGLALSALGDVLLVWPARLAAGMSAFGAAHLAYVCALGWRPRAPCLGAALYAAAAVYVWLVRPPPGLRALLPFYAALLTTMAWRGTARGGAAAAGALLFLVSDAVLGYTLFAGPLPYGQVIVMSTYYTAQLGLAYSALRDASEAPSPR